MHHGDLTPGVEFGLGIYYLIAAVANVAFGWYQAKTGGRGLWWFLMAAVFGFLAGLNFAQRGFELPLWYRDLSDYGLHAGLVSLGISGGANDWLVGIVQGVLYGVAIVFALDFLGTYFVGGKVREFFNSRFVMRRLETSERMAVWLLLTAVLSVLIFGTNAISFFILSVAAFAALVVWRRALTEPNAAWFILNVGLIFGGLSMTDADFRHIIIKPDNVPIVGLVGVVGFFTWLYFRRSVINDDRIAQGLPPLEKEDDEKVLVWPDLVYTELICMVVVTIILVIWSVALPAPLEQPASSTKTPNPSKAPWYFLGLQEMLVYYDPWIAGVVLPTIIIIGLIALPYIDFNQKGNGYFTFKERSFSVVTFLFGFIVLWVTLIFLGTFLRGPNWNFFGLYEFWSPYKLVPLNNVNLSEYFWIRWLGKVWEHPPGGVSWGVILIREAPGILIILAYFLVLPPLLAKTVLRSFFIRMGFVRYFILVNLILFMASLPIKMVFRWAMNLKYFVAIPEYFFNI